MARPEKVDVVTDIRERLQNAKAVFVTDYSGLNVEQITKLRKNLRENRVAYVVAKNTLMAIAARETGHESLVGHMKGQTALAFGADDPAVAAKILYTSFKEIEKPIIRAFILEGEIHSGKEIVRLAELPSREILLAQLIGVVESPLTAIIYSLDAVFQELVGTVDALAAARKE